MGDFLTHKFYSLLLELPPVCSQGVTVNAKSDYLLPAPATLFSVSRSSLLSSLRTCSAHSYFPASVAAKPFDSFMGFSFSQVKFQLERLLLRDVFLTTTLPVLILKD